MLTRRMPDCRMDSAAVGRADSPPAAAVRAVCARLTVRAQRASGCRWRRFIAGCLLASVVGCQSLTGDGLGGMFGNVRRSISTDGIRGPLERSLGSEDNVLELGRKYSPEAKAKVDAAQALFDQGDYKGAARGFKSAAKKYKDSSIGEEAQYRLAETWYAMGDLPKSQDAFDQLFADYPSTRYVEPATRRLFTIAKQWLEISDPVARNEIRQVSGEQVVADNSPPPKPPLDPTLRVRILPNFHDGSRPVFDTQGRALQALKAIWLNDPTGPLADDSLMLTATYYQRTQNYVEADRYYKILREEYPDSPHFEKAYVLGSHVKLMSYQGPYYEGSDLETAQKLKEQSLHLFPASATRTQTRRDLDKVYLMQAERAWKQIEYYQKKRRPRAIAIACMNLLTEYPDTPYAAQAREILTSIDRSELQGLPEIAEFLQNLPAAEPPRTIEQQPPIKSVRDSRVDTSNQGHVRL